MCCVLRRFNRVKKRLNSDIAVRDPEYSRTGHLSKYVFYGASGSGTTLLKLGIARSKEPNRKAQVRIIHTHKRTYGDLDKTQALNVGHESLYRQNIVIKETSSICKVVTFLGQSVTYTRVCVQNA
jgi:hypothetical protein